MPDPTDAHVSAARRILLQECGGEDGGNVAVAAGRVWELLFSDLSPVLGGAGVRALLARCVKLRRADHPCLSRLVVPSEASQQSAPGAQEVVAALRPLSGEQGREVAVALYATFFSLLTTFIGERLTWQIVQRAFDKDDGTASMEVE